MQAKEAGLAVDAALFFEDAGEAGDQSAASRARRATRFCLRVPEAPMSSGPWRGLLARSRIRCSTGCSTKSCFTSSRPSACLSTSRCEPRSPALRRLFLCVALGPWLIAKLREFQIGQYIREDGPKSHMKKAGTPTMGGILIIISIVVPTLLWANLGNRLRLDRAVRAGQLWADRIFGRLRQDPAQTESGPDGERKISRCRCWRRW